MKPALSINNLSISLPKGADRPYAVKDLSLNLNENEILCLVGESGSGKSILSNAILGLLPDRLKATHGEIFFEGQDLLKYNDEAMRKIRGARIAMIFQEPMTALNPLKTIGDQIAEMYTTHTPLRKQEINRKVIDLLSEVRIPNPETAAKSYPHELSGGQRQRAMIAMALALEPKILIADEPTTALDVTTQARILELIKQLQARNKTAVLFITHDFGVVAQIASKVAVLQRGILVEQGEASDVLNHAKHPYTRALIRAVPVLEPGNERPLNPQIALKISHVSKSYRSQGLLRKKPTTHAVKDVSLSLHEGSTLGIVGESGSGKSTLARCIVRLLDVDGGQIECADIDIAFLKGRALRQHSKHIQMVFQDPYASLNPRRKVGDQVATGPQLHGVSKAKAWEKARFLFTRVGLDEKSMDRYPHEFSGGQRQRIGLARALALEPKILVADEPVSALDVSVQEQVLRLLTDIQKEFGLSVILITHDLRVAAQVCDQIVVMKSGEIVEHKPAAQLFLHPEHEYTQRLLNAVPGKHWNPVELKNLSSALYI